MCKLCAIFLLTYLDDVPSFLGELQCNKGKISQLPSKKCHFMSFFVIFFSPLSFPQNLHLPFHPVKILMEVLHGSFDLAVAEDLHDIALILDKLFSHSLELLHLRSELHQ